MLVETAAKKAVADFLGADAGSEAMERIDGRASNEETRLANLAAVEASIMTPPFLEPIKITWWRRVDYLPSGDKVSAEVKARLIEFAEKLKAAPLPSNQLFIITTAKCQASSVFAKTIAEVGAVQSFDAPAKAKDRFALALSRVAELAQNEGLSFAPGVDELFISTVGNDTRTIISELAKLHTYKLHDGNNVVSAADVANVSSYAAEEPDSWDLTDAFGMRNSAKLLQILERFDIEATGTVMMLFAIVERFFREAVVYREAMERGYLTPAGWSNNISGPALLALNETGLGPDVARSPWAAKKAAQNLRYWSLMELRLARKQIIEARERITSTGDSYRSGELLIHVLLRVIKR